MSIASHGAQLVALLQRWHGNVRQKLGYLPDTFEEVSNDEVRGFLADVLEQLRTELRELDLVLDAVPRGTSPPTRPPRPCPAGG